MRVYLLRHGATEATAEGRYQGWLDAPLSLAGRRALQRAAFSPQHVYVSVPLRATLGVSFRVTRPTVPGWTAVAKRRFPAGRGKRFSVLGCAPLLQPF